MPLPIPPWGKIFIGTVVIERMVRSLLHSAVLERRSGFRYAVMVLGVCVLLGSAPLWLGMADFDYQFSYEGRVADPTFQQELETTPYQQLDADIRPIVDNALDGRSYTFEDGTRSLPEYVSRDGTLHGFDSRRAVDWTNPGSSVPILSGLVGLWLVFEAVQHERKHLGPFGH
jgi:hypothetical protein